MIPKRPIRVTYVSQEYPVFYQPYIPPVMEALFRRSDLVCELQVYKFGEGAFVKKLPSYQFRRVFEKVHDIVKRQAYPLGYIELQAIKEGTDIIHIQDSFLFQKVYGLLHLNAVKKPKVVITLRGSETYIKPWDQEKWQTFFVDHGNKVDAFIVMSHHQKRYLNEKWGIALGRIHVIPISYGDEVVTAPKRIEGKDCLQIVSAFRMCWEKNIEGNLRTIKCLDEKGVPVRYDLYGDGPDSGQVPYLIDKYALGHCVRYHGSVSNAILKARLRDYDFFLQLSHSEAFPTSVLEAQAFGLPAIVSDSGGLPEAILPNESGYCVPSYDSEQAALLLLELFRAPEQYHRFSQAGIAHVQHNFTVNHEVSRLTNLYKALVG